MGFTLNLSSNNEVVIIPDFRIYGDDGEAVFDNKESKAPMKVVFRKINGFLLQNKVLQTSLDEEGKVSAKFDKMKYIEQVFIRFEDSIKVNLDDKGEKDLTLTDVVEHIEFTELLVAMYTEATKILSNKKKKVEETKKS